MSMCKSMHSGFRGSDIAEIPVPSGGIAKPTEETHQKAQFIPCKGVLKL